MFGNKKRWPVPVLVTGLVALVSLAGCGKDPSVASRSAAAFREAEKKGTTSGRAAGSHGHGALTPAAAEGHSGMSGMDLGGKGDSGKAGMAGMKMDGKESGMKGMGMGSRDHSGMSGMDMGGKGHSGMAGMGGMKMGGKGQPGMSGMDMGSQDHSGMATGGKDHSGTAMGGMDHSGMATGGKNPSSEPPTLAAPVSASPGQPEKTLSSDPLDSPAPTSVLDARRSAAMSGEMSGGMSGMGGHGAGTYRQVDAGRGPEAYEGSEKQTPGAGPHQHGQADPPSPPVEKGEHAHATGAAQEEAVVYTCPMHPEVTSTTPGKCPKCGMTLVKRRKE